MGVCPLFGGNTEKNREPCGFFLILLGSCGGTHNVSQFFSWPYYSTKLRKNQESKFWNGDDR